MPQLYLRTRRSQLSLFHPAPRRPAFQTLPPEIQDRTIRLLARLLRLHIEQPRGAEAREADHE